MLHLSYPDVYTKHSVPPHSHIKEVQKVVINMGVESGLKESAASAMANILIKGNEIDTPIHWAQTVADLLSDVMFVCPTYQFIDKLLTLNTTAYLYLFAQRAANSEWGQWMQVTHHDEVNFVMGYPLRYPQIYSKNDVEISRLMIRTWTHFAQHGLV